MAGAVGGVAGPPHRRLAEIARVAAEAALVDEAVGGAAEGQAHVLEVVDRLDRFLGEDGRRVLVDEIVAALDRVEGVPLRLVLLQVAEGRADASLGGARVAAHGIELGDDRDPPGARGLEGSVQAGAAGADDHRVVFVLHFNPSSAPY